MGLFHSLYNRYIGRVLGQKHFMATYTTTSTMTASLSHQATPWGHPVDASPRGNRKGKGNGSNVPR